MHPRPPLAGPPDDVGEGVERAGVHLPCLRAYHGRTRHVRGQAVGPHPPLVVNRDPADSFPAQPHHPEGPDQRGVGILADDHGQLRRPEQPVRLHIPAGPGQLMIPGRRQSRRVGHGSAGHEHRRARGRQGEQLGQPPRHDRMQAGRNR